jgi:hypothetical protein
LIALSMRQLSLDQIRMPSARLIVAGRRHRDLRRIPEQAAFRVFALKQQRPYSKREGMKRQQRSKTLSN